MRNVLLLAIVLLPRLSGCSTSARRQLADSRQRIETLQAQSDQLRNETLTLRNRNRELSQRAVDDALKLRDLEQANARLEQSIVGYQDERRQITRAFEQFQSQVHRQAMAEDPTPQARVEPGRPLTLAAATDTHAAGSHSASGGSSRPLDSNRFVAFARAQAGTRYDAARDAWTMAPEALFRPGSSELNARAPLILDAFGRLLSSPEDPAIAAQIVFGSPEVQQTSLDGGAVAGLESARAEVLRSELAKRLKVEPESIRLAPDPSSKAAELAIEIAARP
jgi:hypothetical protein